MSPRRRAPRASSRVRKSDAGALSFHEIPRRKKRAFLSAFKDQGAALTSFFETRIGALE